MEAIRTIQTPSESKLTIDLPASFVGRQVEVIVMPMEEVVPAHLPPEEDPRYARFIQKQPPLSPHVRKMLEENPNLLKGSVLYYDDPFEPAVPPEDWESSDDTP